MNLRYKEGKEDKYKEEDKDKLMKAEMEAKREGENYWRKGEEEGWTWTAELLEVGNEETSALLQMFSRHPVIRLIIITYASWSHSSSN